ncbi:hypothetical protein LJK87_48210 [Paenibacillus sp. P25]|nr:hypothetical protein LJK87_48210 [Paenibacillus sp. P25]
MAQDSLSGQTVAANNAVAAAVYGGSGSTVGGSVYGGSSVGGEAYTAVAAQRSGTMCTEAEPVRHSAHPARRNG